MQVICSICLSDLKFSNQNISVSECGHIFHHDCLQDWIGIRQTCPECRCQLGENSLVKKVYPKMSEECAIVYNGNSSESKDLFDLLAKNSEFSQKAVCNRIVKLENEKHKLEKEKLNIENEKNNIENEKNSLQACVEDVMDQVETLKKDLMFANTNVKYLTKTNYNLKMIVRTLQADRNQIAASVNIKVKNAVQPYLKLKKEIESYKEKFGLLNNLSSETNLQSENHILENLPSTSKS